MEKANPKAPALQIHAGNCHLSIFKKDIEKDGKSFSVYSFSLQRSYEDKDGKRAFSSSLNREDLPVASMLLQKAFWEVSTSSK